PLGSRSGSSSPRGVGASAIAFATTGGTVGGGSGGRKAADEPAASVGTAGRPVVASPWMAGGGGLGGPAVEQATSASRATEPSAIAKRRVGGAKHQGRRVIRIPSDWSNGPHGGRPRVIPAAAG